MKRYTDTERRRIVQAAKAMPNLNLQERAALLNISASTLSTWLLADEAGLSVLDYRRKNWTSEPGYSGPAPEPKPEPAPAPVTAPAPTPAKTAPVRTIPLFEEGDGSVQEVTYPHAAPFAPAAPRILLAPDLQAVVASILVLGGHTATAAVSLSREIISQCHVR
jgi:transposase-like protein